MSSVVRPTDTLPLALTTRPRTVRTMNISTSLHTRVTDYLSSEAHIDIFCTATVVVSIPPPLSLSCLLHTWVICEFRVFSIFIQCCNILCLLTVLAAGVDFLHYILIRYYSHAEVKNVYNDG